MPSNYSDYTDSIIRNTTFANSPSLGRNTHAAYPLLLIGTLCSGLSALLSVRSCSSWSLTWLTWLSPTQDLLGALYIRRSFLHRRYLRSHWCNHLDSHHQEGGTHQFVDAPTFPNSHRHSCVYWKWVILCLGSVRLSGGEHHLPYYEVRAVPLSDSHCSRSLIRSCYSAASRMMTMIDNPPPPVALRRASLERIRARDIHPGYDSANTFCNPLWAFYR